MKTLILQVLALLIPLLIPLAAGFLAVEWAKFSAWVSSWPKWVTELFGVVFAGGVGLLSQVLGITIPGDFTTWDQGVLAAILMAAARVLLGVSNVAKTARLKMGLKH
jgi:hypothetical protein